MGPSKWQSFATRRLIYHYVLGSSFTSLLLNQSALSWVLREAIIRALIRANFDCSVTVDDL